MQDSSAVGAVKQESGVAAGNPLAILGDDREPHLSRLLLLSGPAVQPIGLSNASKTVTEAGRLGAHVSGSLPVLAVAIRRG